MHFNIYLDDDTGQQLNRLAQQRGQTRNSLIRRALADWLNREQGSDWPAQIVNFRGCPDWPPFESHRGELSPLPFDPLG